MRAKELRAKRAEMIESVKGLVDKAEMTPEDHAKFDEVMAKADQVKAQIEAIERQAVLAAELGELHGARADARGVSVDQHVSEVDADKKAFVAYLRAGLGGLDDAQRRLQAERTRKFENVGGTNTNGAGYIIAPDFQRELLIAMKAQGGMRAAARELNTATGVDLPWPMMDDTGQVATIVGENTQLTPDADLNFTSITLKGYTYKAGPQLVSLQLLQDSAFDFDTLIRNAVAGRFVRGQNAHFTNGSGTGQPQGIVTAVSVGKTGATGQTTSVVVDDLIDLEHSVDPVYRAGAGYMFHDSTLRVLRKLKDTQGRPIYTPNYAEGAPDVINGRPYTINQDMPVMAAGAKSILFGDVSSCYVIRDILGMQALRLTERYADYLQVGYLFFMRTDGRFVSAAMPVKAYQNSAS